MLNVLRKFLLKKTPGEYYGGMVVYSIFEKYISEENKTQILKEIEELSKLDDTELKKVLQYPKMSDSLK